MNLCRAGLGVVLSCVMWAQVAVTPVAPVRSPLEEYSTTIERLVQKVNPAVVQIQTERYGPREDGGMGSAASLTRQSALGTGVFVSADGDIITNAHVVEGAWKIEVRLHGRGEARAQMIAAEVVGIDRETDLAVLRVKGVNWPHLVLGDSASLRQGQMVLAMGNPRGLENSVSMGVVSAVARQVSPDASQTFVQTDASINPGNSGGPLVNLRGEVVGINTFILSQSGGSEGLGFAVPSSLVRDVYKQIKKYGRVRRGELGVVIRSVTPVLAAALNLPREDGVLIQDVREGKAAAAAGVKLNDIVIRVEGRMVRNVRQFANSLFRSEIGGNLTLEVIRGDKMVLLKVALPERDDEVEGIAQQIKEQSVPVPPLGILAVAYDKSTAGLVLKPRYEFGLIVTAKLSTNASLQEELEAGDLLVGVNGKIVGDFETLKKILDGIGEAMPIVVQVQRGEILRYLVLRGG